MNNILSIMEENLNSFTCTKKIAFTLAEVLITLGIIGIVAAMTLPTLIGHYKHKQAETQIKKAYSVLSQALLSAQSKHGEEIDWAEWDDAEIILRKYIAPEIKGAKVYEKTMSTICPDGRVIPYYWMNGVGISSPFTTETASTRLTDGVCIGLNPNLIGGTWDKMIYMDLNGSRKGPNKAGYDLFFFKILNNNILPMGYDLKTEDLSTPTKHFSCNPNAPSGGFTCAAKVMRDNWEINYW